MPVTECPYCYQAIRVDKQPRMGQKVVCPSCRETAEVVWLTPIELDLPIDDDVEQAGSLEEDSEDPFLNRVTRRPA